MCDIIEEGVVDVSTEDSIKELIEQNDRLTEKEKQVLRLRFGLEDGRRHTLDEVGEEFGITRQRVRQIERKAFRGSCPPRRSKKLKDFLD